MQKTILLAMYEGTCSKVFFPTDSYQKLVENKNIRVVVVAPSSKMDFYNKEFGRENVIFEPFDIKPEPWLGQVLCNLAFNLLGTKTIRFKQRLAYFKYGNLPKFVFLRLINIIFGPFKIIREIIRFLDGFVPTDKGIEEIFDKYKPDIYLAPDIVFPPDRHFLRVARKKKVFTIGMTRSWDNLTSKGIIQILPDKLVLHTTRMKRQAVDIVGMPEKDIVVTGPSDYDKYFRLINTPREEFFKRINANPSHRLVLFTPFYDAYTGSAIVMMNSLVEAMEDGKLPSNIHILVRYRPHTPEIDSGLIKTSPRMTITKPVGPVFKSSPKLRLMYKRDLEYSAEEQKMLVDSLFFSSLVITTYSTLGIEAAALDKPVIGVRFDADPKCPREHCVKYLADRHDHYRELEATGGIRLVYNMNELINAINAYLKDPSIDKEGRRKMVAEQVEFCDGFAGRRVAQYIRETLFKL